MENKYFRNYASIKLNIKLFEVFFMDIKTEEKDILKNRGKELIIEEYPVQDIHFKRYREFKPPIKRILKNKTLCLSSHKPHVINYKICPDCNAVTTRTDPKYAEILEKLIDSKIPQLRRGIPGSKEEKRRNCLKGPLKQNMNYYKMGIITGYKEKYPIDICNLEKLSLISFQLWNILYSLEGDLGTFIGIEEPFEGIYIPERLSEEKLFTFIGHHESSNKQILILSPHKKFTHPKISDITLINQKLAKINQYLDIKSVLSEKKLLYDKFRESEWYLIFEQSSNIFIIPQEKSYLDIQFIEDLEQLLTIADISRIHQKPSLLEWDIDEGLSF